MLDLGGASHGRYEDFMEIQSLHVFFFVNQLEKLIEVVIPEGSSDQVATA